MDHFDLVTYGRWLIAAIGYGAATVILFLVGGGVAFNFIGKPQGAGSNHFWTGVVLSLITALVIASITAGILKALS